MNKKLLLLIAFFFTFVLGYGQSASKYCFAPVNGTYVPLTGAIDVLGLTSTKDDGFSSIFPLDTTTPFNFVFGGVSYSQIQVSSNGLLSFKNTAINETFYGKTATDISDRKPFLAPLWDDLANTSVPRYVVTGSAPNRIFKIEWSGQKWNYLSAANVISFQVWLYETSNIIEYIYNRGAANINGAPAATIGIYDAASTSLTLSNSSANPTTSSTAVLATINAKPANGQIYRFTPNVTPTGSVSQVFCASTSPTVASLAATGTDIKWYNAVTGGSALASSTPLINGTHYYATQTISGCESSTRFDVTATVSNTTVPTGTALQMYCSGAKVSNLTATGTAIKWYTTSSGGSALATTTDLVNGTHYYATQTVGGCESSTRFDVTVIINSAPTITPNKVDETCSTTNNGSISPTLIGGLTNVRYIKLTQKYNVDAWQQVAEIEAFEIFTGTNVARSTNGASATSSSNYSSQYTAPIAIDGINSGNNNFWHSGTPNLNEWIKVDLQSGKNLDNIRIYNRTDCCSQRGQNMLLELFDSSDNLIYSKTIDLYQSGANIPVNVNVLDVSWADGATTLNRTGLDSGTYILNYADARGCSLSSPINIGSAIIAPATPGAITGDVSQCRSSTAMYSIAAVPNAVSYNWTTTGSAGWTITPAANGLSVSVAFSAGATSGNLQVTATNGCGTSTPRVATVTISTVDNTWNGSVWSTGVSPSSTLKQRIIFAGNFNQNVDLVACSCLVSGSAAVTISENRTLFITNDVEVVGGAVLTFENRASLVQINDAAVNKGNIIYKRLTNKGVRNTDYTYWSTPVSPLNLEGTGGISYNPSNLVGSIFYSYEVTVGSEDWKSESATSPMIVGKGYSIRGPGPISVSPLTPLEATFTGKPNNGPYPITGIYPYKSYLLGNPYPSALDADKFLRDNAGVIDGTLYFWTHSTKIGIGVVNPGTGVYAYSGDDYASYNLTGGVGTDGVAYPQGGVQAPSSPGFKPTGKIGAGQGFFATSNTTIKGTNEIVFNNSMRVGVGGITGNNSQFFKTNSTKSKTTSTIEKNRLWLNLTNTQGAFKQLLVGYITGATNDHDNGYDGETFDGNEFLDFYSVNQEKNFVIQGRALPFDLNDEVSLGYRSVAAGDFSIGIDEVDGVMLSQKVYIEDKLLNVAHDLKASPYDFTTQAGTFNDRFVLRYVDKTLGTGDFETADDKIIISVKNKQIKIDSPNETIDKVLIFDLLGKEIYRKISIGKNEHTIANLSSSEQALIVKVVLQNGQTVSRKIIF